MNYTRERIYFLPELKAGKWYNFLGQTSIAMFKEPNLGSEVVKFLKWNQMFMLIQQLGNLSPTDDPANDCSWVYLGVEEQFGYVYFGVTTLFQEIVPGED
jgi:hypothetical protein